MKKADDEFKRLIYDLMNGSLDLENYTIEESRYVENEFEEERTCGKAYSEILAAYRRICERLDVGEEDYDVEIIMNSFHTIIECLCMKMYDYGQFFSQPSVK